MSNGTLVVVGAGNAALCAAMAARENGARVLILEAAPEHEKGGNSYFTAGGFRFCHTGVDDAKAGKLPFDIPFNKPGGKLGDWKLDPDRRAWLSLNSTDDTALAQV